MKSADQEGEALEGSGTGDHDADRLRRERWTAGILGSVAILAVVAVKAWLRPSVHDIGIEDFGLLGWAPSFLTGFGLPYVFFARMRTLPTSPFPRGSFGECCFWAWMVIWSLELLDLLLRGRVFDTGDLLAAVLGIAAAWRLHQLAWSRRMEAVRKGIPRREPDLDG